MNRIAFEKLLVRSKSKLIFYKYLKSVLHTKTHDQINLHDSPGALISEPYQVAKILNDHFSSVYAPETISNVNFYSNTLKSESVIVTGNMIRNALRSKCSLNVVGVDGIPYRF